MDQDINLMNKEELIKLLEKEKSKLVKLEGKIQKVEESYVSKLKSEKNLLSDRKQLENFLQLVFPKEVYEDFIKSEAGNYQYDDLKKRWLINETKKESEFQKLLSITKQDNYTLNETISQMKEEIESKHKELLNLSRTIEENQSQLIFYQSNYKTLQKKKDEEENEKNYLLKIIDEKNLEIDRLQAIELEYAESKARKILENDDAEEEEIFETKIKLKKDELKIGNICYLESLNSGCQTLEIIYSQESYEKIITEKNELQASLKKLKLDFNVNYYYFRNTKKKARRLF